MCSKTPREKRVICIPCDLKTHQTIIKDAVKYRDFVDKLIKNAPELFPLEIKFEDKVF